MRERPCKGYTDRGATLRPVVVTLRKDGMWTPFNGNVCESNVQAERIAREIKMHNNQDTLDQVGIIDTGVAEVWVYENGQICSGLITMEETEMDVEEAWRTVLDSASSGVEAREAALNVLVWLANGGVGVDKTEKHNVTRMCEAVINGEFDRLDP